MPDQAWPGQDRQAGPEPPDLQPDEPVAGRHGGSQELHTRWRGLLGLDSNPEAPKKAWTGVKALSRRLAEGWNDEYDNLEPVADLRYHLQMQVYLMLQRPERWSSGEPGEDEKQATLDALSNAVTNRLVE